jgi:hypothetical protein
VTDQQGSESFINEGCVGGPQSEPASALEELRVDRGAQTCATHATSMPLCVERHLSVRQEIQPDQCRGLLQDPPSTAHTVDMAGQQLTSDRRAQNRGTVGQRSDNAVSVIGLLIRTANSRDAASDLGRPKATLPKVVVAPVSRRGPFAAEPWASRLRSASRARRATGCSGGQRPPDTVGPVVAVRFSGA